MSPQRQEATNVLPVSDAFLLSVAEVSSALIGLFLIGMFFYVETGFRRLSYSRDVLQPYFRASTRIVLILYSIPIGLSLALVSLRPAWGRALFALLSVVLVAANVDTAVRLRSVAKATGSRMLQLNEVVSSLGVLALVSVPWVLGGLRPSREDLTWAILLAFATGFLSILTAVLSAFDFAAKDEEHKAG